MLYVTLSVMVMYECVNPRYVDKTYMSLNAPYMVNINVWCKYIHVQTNLARASKC